MWEATDAELQSIVAEMTVSEKVDLLSGNGLWKTAPNYRLNVPEIVMTDGTYGVRYQADLIDGINDDRANLEQFLAVVNRRTEHTIEGDFSGTSPATCFPNGSSFACSWDIDLAHELGAALASECQALGVNLLLGPGINIRRTPLGGRSYEYYSEDPLMTGDIAAAVISGLQDSGVGASLKHLACNNSEVQRTTMSSDVDERSLREIYLAGFERAIRKSNPWTVMSSYNRLNGVQAAENGWLLTKVLRDDWEYDGVVVSDWHGIKDRAAAANAGNDLDMPASKSRKRQLQAAIANGDVKLTSIDQSCLRVLQLVRRVKAGERRDAVCDFAGNHALARRMAAESIVLLKNDDNVLPLTMEAGRIAVIGDAATAPIFQGWGCATTHPSRVDKPLDEIKTMAAAAGQDVQYFPLSGRDKAKLAEEAVNGASEADVVLFFANTENLYDGEGSDRTHLGLSEGQDALIARVAAVNQRTVVIVASPDAVEMPWLSKVPSVLATFFAGQGMGHAVASILFGATNPSGKLTVTFPTKLEDTPAYLHYPGENDRHVYSEGIYVGYRYYDRRRIQPLFPFGFGLSYTQFVYSDLHLDRTAIRDGDTLKVSFAITNRGEMAGKEICQLYGRPVKTRLHRPLRELKGFAKVDLQPGETQQVTIEVEARDLRYFDPEHGDWLLDAGAYGIEIGASSRDIRLQAEIVCDAPPLAPRRLTLESQPFQLFQTPVGRDKLSAFFRRRLGLDDYGADQLVTYCSESFVGIHSTIEWFAGETIAESEVQQVIDEINQANGWTAERNAA
jgi:beta-glucosidase